MLALKLWGYVTLEETITESLALFLNVLTYEDELTLL